MSLNTLAENSDSFNSVFYWTNYIVGREVSQAFGHKMRYLVSGKEADTAQAKYHIEQFIFNSIM